MSKVEMLYKETVFSRRQITHKCVFSMTLWCDILVWPWPRDLDNYTNVT